jgi:GT2 family glycosyltransferase
MNVAVSGRFVWLSDSPVFEYPEPPPSTAPTTKTMDNEPLVSVVLSVFNGADFLRQAVESILDQTFRDFEFIIIDDGSSDDSTAILNSYQGTDPRVQIFRQTNKGLIVSLNRGCALARGKYIARMDADDIALKERLAWQVQYMEAHPDTAVLGGAVRLIDGAGRLLRLVQHPCEDHEIKSALLQQYSLPHPAVLIRKDVFLSVGGYRATFVDAEDYDLWLRIAEQSRLANLEQVVIYYRLHRSQVSKRKVRQQTLSTLAAQAVALTRRSGKSEIADLIAGPITPQLLTRLGVSEGTLQNALARQYLRWIGNMHALGEYAAAFELWTEMFQSCSWHHIERRVAAEIWLAVVPLYWRRGRFTLSMRAAGRSIAARPRIAVRPLKRVFCHFMHLLSQRHRTEPVVKARGA